ncbi:circadian clock-controlled protein daywake-like [Arctopsyche grandis]|uniref:circadian clock-controlled protein daywake-like n=1 Tax=Arctopsyche grandis TaxID=121162 RepID=UPI00406D8323
MFWMSPECGFLECIYPVTFKLLLYDVQLKFKPQELRVSNKTYFKPEKMRVLLLVIAICAAVQGAIIPKHLKICGQNDVNKEKCLKKSVSSIVKSLANGIPELNLPPLDPYELEENVVEYRQKQFIAKFSIKNIKAYGFSSSKVRDVRLNFIDDQILLEIDLANPRIFVEGSYRADVGFEPTLYTTENAFNNTMTDLKWTWKMTGTVENTNGENYVRITKFFMSPKVGNMVFIQPDVFADNPMLNKLTQDFISIYWKDIYEQLLPVFQPIWNEIGISICNKIFLNAPLKEIFPSN